METKFDLSKERETLKYMIEVSEASDYIKELVNLILSKVQKQDKEFIRLLKEESNNLWGRNIRDIPLPEYIDLIDKLAGKSLT